MPSTNAHRFPTEPVSLTKHPATLPQARVSEDVDHVSVSAEALKRLARKLGHEDLAENAIWRDTVALTGTLRTFFQPAQITKVWRNLTGIHKPADFQIVPQSSRVVRLGPETAWVEARFTFQVDGERPARCSGILGLVPGHGGSDDWKIWLLCTILEQPLGWPDVDHLEPVDKARSASSAHCHNGISSGDPSNGSADTTKTVDCLVVGASMAGLTMAARLKALKLSYLAVEKHARLGDLWLHDRYESVKLHTSKEYSQMPYYPRTYGPDAPYNLTGKDLAKGFQEFVETFGIDVLTSTTLDAASWDVQRDCWRLLLTSRGEGMVLWARHVVLAVGNNGVIPSIPEYSDRDLFKGQIIHSKEWRSAEPWKGKHGIVIGSANTAQDVAADMCRAGLKSVTMVQRSKTWVMPQSTFSVLVDPVYNADIPLELSDRMLMGYPLPVQRLMAMAGIRMCADAKPEYFDKFEANGFDLERHGDLWGLMYDREGGHFFDTGNGRYISDGLVKVISGTEPCSYTETGLRTRDGQYLNADVVVFATGYHGNHIKETASRVFGPDIAESLEDFFPCDKEGESRGAWKDTGRKSNTRPSTAAFADSLQTRGSGILGMALRTHVITRVSWRCISRLMLMASRSRCIPIPNNVNRYFSLRSTEVPFLTA